MLGDFRFGDFFTAPATARCARVDDAQVPGRRCLMTVSDNGSSGDQGIAVKQWRRSQECFWIDNGSNERCLRIGRRRCSLVAPVAWRLGGPRSPLH